MKTADTVIIYDGGFEGKWPRGLSDVGSIGQPATVFCGRLIDPTMSRETRLHRTTGRLSQSLSERASSDPMDTAVCCDTVCYKPYDVDRKVPRNQRMSRID